MSRYLNLKLALACIPAFASASSLIGETRAMTFHSDYRLTPRLDIRDGGFGPVYSRGASYREIAERFLKENRLEYRIESVEDQLAFTRIQESLDGVHVYYRQVKSGVDVHRGGITVSMRQDGPLDFQDL